MLLSLFLGIFLVSMLNWNAHCGPVPDCRHGHADHGLEEDTTELLIPGPGKGVPAPQTQGSSESSGPGQTSCVSDPSGESNPEMTPVVDSPFADPAHVPVHAGPLRPAIAPAGPAAARHPPHGPAGSSLYPPGHAASYLYPPGPPLGLFPRDAVFKPGKIIYYHSTYEHGNDESETREASRDEVPPPPGRAGSSSRFPSQFHPDSVGQGFNPNYDYSNDERFFRAFLVGQFPPGTITHHSNTYEQGDDHWTDYHYERISGPPPPVPRIDWAPTRFGRAQSRREHSTVPVTDRFTITGRLIAAALKEYSRGIQQGGKSG